MPYLGNTPSNQAYAPLIDYFSGDANTTVFTLSRPVASEAGILVIVNNVPQQPEDSYGVSGSTLTFTSAPSTGIDNIWVQYTSLITTVIAPSFGTVGVSQLSASGTANGTTFLSGNNTWQTVTASGGGGLTWQTVVTSNATVSSSNAYAVSTVSGPVFITLPSSPGLGNSVQLSDYAGTWSANSVTVVGNGANIQGATANVVLSTNRQSVAFVYIDTAQGWIPYSQGAGVGTYTIDYLVVAGGGSGGGQLAGGGGAGGLLTGSGVVVSPGVAYTITVGAGGASISGYSSGVNGSNSSAFIYTAIGGGGGGYYNGAAGISGSAGGSGGGGGVGESSSGGSGGSGTSGQGYAGGGTTYRTGTPYPGAGGGGGSSAAGESITTQATTGGVGGAGTSSSITGTAAYYAGGGGGAGYSGTGGAGGAGGGGTGGSGSGSGSNGTANTGGGGGGSAGGSPATSGAGGSGVVIIRYTGAQRGTGGTVTTSGGYTIHTFTSSSTYTA